MAKRSAIKNTYWTLALIWVGLAVYVLLEQASGHLTFRDFAIQPIARLRLLTNYFWVPWLLLALVVLALSRRFPIRPGAVAKPLAIHIGAFLVLTVTHGLMIAYVYAHSDSLTDYMATFYPWQHSGHFLFGDYMLVFDMVIYSILVATMNIRGFLDELKRRDTDAVRMRQLLAENRLHTLRMQLNPHFLFNALNSVSALVSKNEPASAREAIQHISRFLRMTLDDSLARFIPLSQELQFVSEYLEIVRLRFGDRLDIRIDCDDKARDCIVPALLLQPLVENAVEHGFRSVNDDCRIGVSCKTNVGRLSVAVSDNGVGAASVRHFDNGPGLGLGNVRERLAHAYGDAASLQIRTATGDGTTIRIEVPISDDVGSSGAGA